MPKVPTSYAVSVGKAETESRKDVRVPGGARRTSKGILQLGSAHSGFGFPSPSVPAVQSWTK